MVKRATLVETEFKDDCETRSGEGFIEVDFSQWKI